MTRNLILYASNTGNTEKVAIQLKESFDDYGWDSELKKLPVDYDSAHPDFDLEEYDFLCVGSPVQSRLPLPRITEILQLTAATTPPKELFPGPKCALVFATYGGGHLGPKEAEPCLSLMDLNLEHMGWKVVGRLAIPGQTIWGTNDNQYFGCLAGRPGQRDMRRVAAFVDEIFDHSAMRRYRVKETLSLQG